MTNGKIELIEGEIDGVNESELQSWAVGLHRRGRKGRFAELRKKGFV